MQYTGTVVKNVEKNANVLLKGVNAPLYSNVQIKVDITGPATPKLLASDSSGVEYDIAQLGSWGPPSGFAVQGDFTNTTPIKATFTEAGSYKIVLSLVDVSNNNSVITSNTFLIEVLNEEPSSGDTTTNTSNNTTNNIANNLTNNAIGELPKTGTSIGEYIIYFLLIGTVFLTFYVFFYKRKYNT